VLDILDVSDLTYFVDGRDLVRVCFDAALGDNVPQELAPGNPKGALLWVQLDVEAPDVSEGFFQVSDATATLSGLHDDIVDIYLQVAPDLRFEIGLYTPLVSGLHVL
jgi:hypothetical protein